ncbi:MAG: hypothetical protein L0Y72_26725 [Gemmataceae bacterium]|nr:hypothetical protein [Gemmataceae bacterium]
MRVNAMDQQAANVKAVFDHALEIESPADRQAYLEKTCADAPDLRQKVEALLRAYVQAGSFLESPAALASPLAGIGVGGVGDTLDEPIREGPGTVIGAYKLMEEIGADDFLVGLFRFIQTSGRIELPGEKKRLRVL